MKSKTKTRVQPNEQEFKSIAVIRALQIGDMLVAVPALRALRASHPNAHIALVGLPWAASFVERFSMYLDELIPFPGFPGLPEVPFESIAFEEHILSMQERNFDLVVQLHGRGSRINPLAMLYKPRHVIGFSPKEVPYYHPDFFMPYPEKGHEIHRLTSLLEYFGYPIQSENLEFPLSESDKAEVRSFSLLLPHRKYVCIHPGTRLPVRRVSADYFAAIADACSAADIPVVFTGSPEEVPLIEEIQSMMRNRSFSAAGKLSLGGSAALIKDAATLVCNNTSVSHISTAFNVPTIILHKGLQGDQWIPQDLFLHTVIDFNDDPSIEVVTDTTLTKIVALTT